MNVRDRSHDAPGKKESRINELTVALDNAERKLAEREALVTAASGQTEAARAQYAHAIERAEALRRRLEASEQQLKDLQQELQQRDDRIATLELTCKENDNALDAINDDVKRLNSITPSERLAAMGLSMESLDQPGTQYKIGRVTTTVGRMAGNDIAINSNSVSRYHARIVVESEGVFLIDLQSTNGCKVNGKSVTRQMIGDGDAISIGHAKFRFSIGAPSAEYEDKEMGETHVLLEDSVILIPAPNSKPKSAQ